jgi:hypothetical protein
MSRRLCPPSTADQAEPAFTTIQLTIVNSIVATILVTIVKWIVARGLEISGSGG